MKLYVAKTMYHKWEEEPISGIARGFKGTFAIFFYGCNMRCVYCQNSRISQVKIGSQFKIDKDCMGETCKLEKVIYTKEELCNEILKAQSKNAASISFITGALYVDEIVETIKMAKEKGLKLPIVYNSSGYETVAQIKKLDGLIDIYLPDFKYFDNELGKKYSAVPNYADVAKLCIAEMYRQIASLRSERIRNNSLHFYKTDKKKECEPIVIVRHLVLPANTENSKSVIKYLYDTYGNDICISIMSQYTPMPNNKDIDNYPELLRKLTKREYEKVVDFAIQIGVKNAFIQEGDVANESFIPEFR